MVPLNSPVGRVGVVCVAIAAGIAGACGSALAQTGAAGAATPAPSLDATATETTTSSRGTLSKMFRPITTTFSENRLEDVMKFLEDYTGATIEVYWAESGSDGLNKDQTISLTVKNLPALTVLERVLAKAESDVISGGNTWQMTEYGAIECGPKSALNKHKRVELYDIHDLLMELPRYDEVPQIDLQSLLQQSQSGGGGGGQSPFRDDQQRQQGRDPNLLTPEQKAQEVIGLITTLIEPEQWVEGGGEGGTIRYYNGNILVNAPDYMHRQINGYTYWPSHTSTVVKGRRYVSLGTDNQLGHIDGFENFPVSAVVGGQVVSSNPGGPGGSTTPAPGAGKPGPGTPGGKAIPAGRPTTKPAATNPAPKKGPNK